MAEGSLRKNIAVGLFLLVAAAGAHAQADTATEATRCVNSGDVYDAEVSIQNCTAIINRRATSAEERALTLLHRARQLIRSADHESALSDFNRAIAIAPNDNVRAYAYFQRGTARVSAGQTSQGQSDLAMSRQLRQAAAPTQSRRRSPSAPPALTRGLLIGRWTDTGDCANSIEFSADGTFMTTAGAGGRWLLSGDQLTFQGNSAVTVRLRAQTRDTITLTNADGSTGSSTRCSSRPVAAPRQVTMPAMPRNVQEALALSRPIDRRFLLGRWTENGNCGTATQFRDDSILVLPDGRSTSWTLEGENLSFSGTSMIVLRVRGVGQDRMLVINSNGSMGQSVRC
jgi:hypothetical protein